MEENLPLINNNSKNERIKYFFINNKKKIIFSIIVLIVIISGVFIYDKYLLNKKKEISDNFNTITIDFSEATKEKTLNSLIEIINKKDSTYSPLSLYFIIDNDLINDQNTINSLFDVLIKETSLENDIKNLIIYKKALYNADNAQEADLLNILKPLINSDSIWKSHALYLMGEYFYSDNQKQKAKEFFNQILSLETGNLEIKVEAEKRLNRDLSE